MTETKEQTSLFSRLTGAKIVSASSSLDTFSLAFSDGNALTIKAIVESGQVNITVAQCPANTLAGLADAVCKVDWSWLKESTIVGASFSSTRLALKLNPAGPLTISCGTWQGSPFLSFQPFRPANR